jgi:hypothetical protein
MRYFDRLLYEALDNIDPSKVGAKIGDKVREEKPRKSLRGQKLYDEMKRIYNRAGKAKGEERDKLFDEAEALKTETNAAEFQKCYDRICEDNRDNKEFAKALEDRSHRGDNLATWMLRHLVNKAQSG